MSWPFKLTPREAFYPDRVEQIERLFSLLESVISGQDVGSEGKYLAGLTVRLIESGQDIPELIPEDLSKSLLGSGPLDFIAACLIECPDFVNALINSPVVSVSGHVSDGMGLELVSPLQDQKSVLIGEFLDEAKELGYSSLAIRLHFRPGADRYPYLIGLLKFIQKLAAEFPRHLAPIEFQRYPIGWQAGSADWKLLWDYPADGEDAVTRLYSGRPNQHSQPEWSRDYQAALTRMEKSILDEFPRFRPALVIDRMLLDLVYEPMLPWIYSGAPLEKLHEKYQPIIREILINQGISQELHAVLERHIWINALAVSPDALRAAGCTLDDLLPPVDSVRTVFDPGETPLFIQGPMGVSWSYDNSYVIDFRRCLEDVVGPITLEAMVDSHLMSGEAITLFLQEADLSAPSDPGEHCEARQLLASSKMNEVVNNPLQSSDALNRIFIYASLLPDSYDWNALTKLFLNRLVTVIREKRHLTANTYVDLRVFVQRSGCQEELLHAALQHQNQDCRPATGVAAMLVDLFSLRPSDLRKLGPGAPAWLKDQLFSADLGL